MTEVRKAAVVGAGVIGAGWAARYLWNGIDVAIYDPGPETERRCREVLEAADRSLQYLYGRPPHQRGNVSFAPDLASAVSGADIVQESAPEREDTKRAVLAEIDASAPAHAPIGSSTSGLLPSRLQADMRHPERFLVSHPFNPVYLLPLVELCAGEQTDPATVQAADAIYRDLGMRPLTVRKEIDGFVADRLLEALWREALWLVHDDVATVAEVDDAVRFGAGLRWALMGSFQTYRIAGGEDGMRHFMAQFGPALKWPWTKLMDVPDLTDAFLDKIGAQSDAQAMGRDTAELERERDMGLIAMLRALKPEGLAAGGTLAEHQSRWAPHPPVDLDAQLPLHLLDAVVPPEAVDYNRHMTESHYLALFGQTADALLAAIGLDADALAAGHSYFTAESHLRHLGQLRLGDQVYLTTQILGADEKRIHAFHRLRRADDHTLAATAEQMYLHVDTTTDRVCPASAAIQANVRRLAAAHATLPQPESAGRAITPVRRLAA
ncbi:carnitine 3-dehydrogenase [Rhodovibrio salinarum]|uniref:L-carnitine dehydrogenase n=1 Tax=Rhodovibrio salinarum TaxID=1087 RepID=A0A934QEP4_9PROT|nr:carnitine 3-dehydrogenase [Rhodovibrio salinarum]MBK1695766.1 carnitine 3-dehydrogenase [Rhodovibrio salinarum]